MVPLMGSPYHQMVSRSDRWQNIGRKVILWGKSKFQPKLLRSADDAGDWKFSDQWPAGESI
jgi:hypothetical protein